MSPFFPPILFFVEALVCQSVCGEDGEYDAYCDFVSSKFLASNVKDYGKPRQCSDKENKTYCYVINNRETVFFLIFNFFLFI